MAAYEYARSFRHLGHDVLVVAPTQLQGNRAWDYSQAFEIVRVPSTKSFALNYYYQRFHLNRLLSRRRFDVLLSQKWNVSGLACDYARHRQAIPHIQWFHGNEIYDHHLGKATWRRRLLESVANARMNVSVSHFTESRMLDRLGRSIRSRVIYHGVDADRFQPSDNQDDLKWRLGFGGRYVLLTLARLVPRKGQDQIIRALPSVIRKIPNVMYVIAGKGRYEKGLKSHAAALGVERYVHFAGFVSEQDKVQYYQMCDQYVMPCREIPEQGSVEGYGLTLLEANACGKPVIAGDSGGCIEAVRNGMNGLVVDPMNLLELTEAILRLHDADFYAKVSRSALSHVRDTCRWDSSAEAVLACLEEG